MILVVVDAHSKWIEAACTSSTSSALSIEVLRSLFARFGFLNDNSTGFISAEFEDFLKKNGIAQTTSAPYHSSSNGLAERAVQIVKKGLKKVTAGSMYSRLKILFSYRITPQATTGSAPAELLLGRRPRTCLDLLKPHTAERVEQKQEQQKAYHDKKAKVRVFAVGDMVFVKNFSAGRRWLMAVIVQKTGPVSFVVELADGRKKRCHQNHLRAQEGVTMDRPQIESDTGEADESFMTPSSGTGIPGALTTTQPVVAGPTAQSTTQPESESNLSNKATVLIESNRPTVTTESNELTTTTESSSSRYPRRNQKPR